MLNLIGSTFRKKKAPLDVYVVTTSHDTYLDPVSVAYRTIEEAQGAVDDFIQRSRLHEILQANKDLMNNIQACSSTDPVNCIPYVGSDDESKQLTCLKAWNEEIVFLLCPDDPDGWWDDLEHRGYRYEVNGPTHVHDPSDTCLHHASK